MESFARWRGIERKKKSASRRISSQLKRAALLRTALVSSVSPSRDSMGFYGRCLSTATSGAALIGREGLLEASSSLQKKATRGGWLVWFFVLCTGGCVHHLQKLCSLHKHTAQPLCLLAGRLLPKQLRTEPSQYAECPSAAEDD